MKRLMLICLASVMTIALAGCVSTDTDWGGLAKDNRLPKPTVIEVKGSILSPLNLASGGQSVLVIWENLTDSKEMDDCQRLLERKLVRLGYNIADQSRNADYVICCIVTHFGLIRNHPDYKVLMTPEFNDFCLEICGYDRAGDQLEKELYGCEVTISISERSCFLFAPEAQIKNQAEFIYHQDKYVSLINIPSGKRRQATQVMHKYLSDSIVRNFRLAQVGLP